VQKQKVLEQIESAFKEVVLGEGIGINQADRIETKERDVLIQKGRNLDRMWWKSWREIEDKYISSYSSVMYYMDAQGRKWALPAYMRYAINHYQEGSFSIEMTLYILEEGEKTMGTLERYTPEQKRAIASFLKFMVDEVGEKWIDDESAQNALDSVWGVYL